MSKEKDYELIKERFQRVNKKIRDPKESLTPFMQFAIPIILEALGLFSVVSLVDNNLNGVYVCDGAKVSSFSEVKDEILCVFKPDNETQLMKLINNVDSVLDIYKDEKNICVNLKVPNKFLEDYEYLQQGKYSKLSEEYKKAFGNQNIEYKVIEKDDVMVELWEDYLGPIPSLREAETEFWYKPNPDDIVYKRKQSLT